MRFVPQFLNINFMLNWSEVNNFLFIHSFMSVTALQTTYQGIWRNEAPTQFSNSDKSIASPSFNSNPEIFPLTGFNRIISMSGATSVTLTSWLEMNMAMVDGHVAESVGNQEKTTGDDSPRLPPNFWDFRNSIRWFCDFVVLLLIASCKMEGSVRLKTQIQGAFGDLSSEHLNKELLLVCCSDAR